MIPWAASKTLRIYRGYGLLRRASTAAARADAVESADPVVRNEVGVQLLTRSLHGQIFVDSGFTKPSGQAIALSRSHLAKHGLAQALSPEIPETDFILPALTGANIDQHFHNLGISQSQPYLSHAADFASCTPPPIPSYWIQQPGWTKYYPDGSYEAVECPTEDAICFDVETLYNISPFSVMATAVSSSAWYGWVSPWLLGQTDRIEQLIPMPGDKQRVIVGHNVAYDRARIREEYKLDRSQNRFIDTMSLHIAVHGLSSPQRMAWMKHRKAKDADENGTEFSDHGKTWQDVSSLNSLVDVAKLHCNIDVDKSTRDYFASESREETLAQFSDLMNYCAKDVQINHQVYAIVLPAFLKMCPSPVSFAGMLQMGNAFLPVNQEWPKFIESANGTFDRMTQKITDELHDLAEKARRMIFERDEEGRFVYETDPWLKQLDWTAKNARRRILRKQKLKAAAAAEAAEAAAEVRVQPSPAPPVEVQEPEQPEEQVIYDGPPKWYNDYFSHEPNMDTWMSIAPVVLKLRWRGFPLAYDAEYGWHFIVNLADHPTFAPEKSENLIDEISTPEIARYRMMNVRIAGIFNGRFSSAFRKGTITSEFPEETAAAIDLRLSTDAYDDKNPKIQKLNVFLKEQADQLLQHEDMHRDAQFQSLDWSPTINETSIESPELSPPSETIASTSPAEQVEVEMDLIWPKWYWDLDSSSEERLNLSLRSRVAPLLFRLNWRDQPIYTSREHGWVYGVPQGDTTIAPSGVAPLMFNSPHDMDLAANTDTIDYYKLPHKDGPSMNVGSPLSKTFISAFESGILSSDNPVVKEALNMNAQCSYWLSARDRVNKQMVVWQDSATKMGFADSSANSEEKHGMILPQIVTMGTVTRRAVEPTWMAASNAKKNRVGSELKAMVRAPEGYSIVGADVDSEELWICCVMGDAQFGFHGATSIGWMTLEGSKAAGTDLHSKTASILGISRDQAKVFNYSRIYGAGVKHAVTLLMQGNPELSEENATKRAKELYSSTKGLKIHTDRNAFKRKFWYGGTESHVFNKMEEVALGDNPRTPALGCGITRALAKAFLPETERSQAGEDFMPSRVNWVVQSSGVDYLHLLIVSMEYLIKRFDINARFMISVHDEIRYLVKNEDRLRAAMALQICNLWTRSLFAHRLQMDDLPQSCAFFSAVDLDHVLRKEVHMDCVTPSQPTPIPFGESMDINQILAKTNNGSLFADGKSMLDEQNLPPLQIPSSSSDVSSSPTIPQPYRSDNMRFLEVQCAKNSRAVKVIEAKMLSEQSKSHSMWDLAKAPRL